jgi:NADPH:quinone reductase-like Zn-dependent oxidoreductase
LGVITSLVALFSDLKLPYPGNENSNSVKGEPILIWGGSGSVGAYAVQLASLIGLHVIATASPHNFEYVKAIGANVVLDYKDADIVNKIREASGGKLKYVFDTVRSNGSAEKAYEVISENEGTIVSALPIKQEDFPKAKVISTYAADIFNVRLTFVC